MNTNSPTRRSYLRKLAVGGGLSVSISAGCLDIIEDTIDIGVLTDRSGSLEEVAATWEDAIQLAVDEINAAGGPLDRELELHIADMENRQDATEAAYEDLVEDHDITAMLGPPAGAFQTDELAATITQDGVMQLLTIPQPRIAEQGIVTDGDRELKLVGRTLANDIQMGVAAAYVLNEIVEADTAWFGWWEPPEEQMLLRAEDLFDGEVVGWYERMFHGRTTFPELVEADPDAFVYFGWDQELTLDGLAEDGYDGDVIFNRGFEQIDLDEFGELADGVYSVEGRPAPTDGTDAFWERFETAGMYDRDWPIAEAYDAVYLLALAMQQAGEDAGPAIAEHIQQVSTSPGDEVTVGDFEEAKALLEDDDPVHYVGASGHVDLNERLEPVYPQAVMQVQDGEAVDVDTLLADFFEGNLYDV